MKNEVTHFFTGRQLYDVSSRPTFATLLRRRLVLRRRLARPPRVLHGRLRSSDLLGEVPRIPSTLPGNGFQGGRNLASLPSLVFFLPNLNFDLV